MGIPSHMGPPNLNMKHDGAKRAKHKLLFDLFFFETIPLMAYHTSRARQLKREARKWSSWKNFFSSHAYSYTIYLILCGVCYKMGRLRPEEQILVIHGRENAVNKKRSSFVFSLLSQFSFFWASVFHVFSWLDYNNAKVVEPDDLKTFSRLCRSIKKKEFCKRSRESFFKGNSR